MLIKQTLKQFDNESKLKSALAFTEKQYRPYDPGWYLYRQVLHYSKYSSKYKKKYEHEFIELVYVTLSAWNMNSRGARLNNFDDFKRSIINNRSLLEKLESKSIKDITKPDIQKTLETLFHKLKLVYRGKPPLVTFSKFLHFYFPKLIVPIDRKYTCKYFYGTESVPSTPQKQFERFIEIETEFSVFYKRHDLKKYLETEKWNLYETKVMDNMIIGFIGKKLKRNKTSSQ